MKNIGEVRILMVPLDWGLGHATRCIPLIREFIKRDCTVFIAGEDKILALLQEEFPNLHFLKLKGYRVTYAKNRLVFAGAIALQIPKILSAIKNENQWLRKVVAAIEPDAIISDNRYGLYHSHIPSVFITHQLCIQTPAPFLTRLLQKLNYRLIGRFHQCWVPDHKEASLAGQLSHPGQLPPVPLTYLGPLSRFEAPAKAVAEKHLLVLLSGPEPQRTLLEQKMLQALQTYGQPAVLVRGLPGESSLPKVAGPIAIYNHLPAARLQQAILEASLVIGRCGYSTVMDLVALQKKSILIPTPGQTEQEYLARHLMEKKLALCIGQEKFSLKAALSLAEVFPYQHLATDGNKGYLPAIEQLLSGLRQRKQQSVNRRSPNSD